MTYPDRVTYENGVYRWKYHLSREQSKDHLYLMLFVSFGISAVVLLIMLIALHGQGWYIYVPIILVIEVGLPLLLEFLTLDNNERSYEMDETCLRHKHASKGGDAVIIFKNIRWMTVKGDEFTIREGITTYTVYVPHADVEMVKNHIRERTGPKAEHMPG